MNILVVHADIRDLRAEDFEGVDTVITDPPYSGHVHANATTDSGGVVHNRDLGFASLDPASRFHALKLMKGCAARWSIVFSDFAQGVDDDGSNEVLDQPGHYVLEGDCAWRVQGVHAGLDYCRLVPWVRWSRPQITGDRPPSGAEAVLHFHRKGKKRWNGPGGLTHYARACLRGSSKHPTEKPLALMLDLVSYYSDPGEYVADFFAGRGTTGQAARILGRDAVLVERDATFAAQAEARVNGPLDPRDRAQVQRYIDTTVDEATEELNSPQATDGTKRRANARLDDAARALAFLEST